MATQRNIPSNRSSALPEMVHVRMSHPQGAPIAEFEMPMTDATRLFLHDKVFRQVDAGNDEPGERLARALDEAATLRPRFKDAQELFDALEGPKRTQER